MILMCCINSDVKSAGSWYIAFTDSSVFIIRPFLFFAFCVSFSVFYILLFKSSRLCSAVILAK